MFPFHSKPDPRPTFEDIFFEHYVRLLEWAMQLTSRNRSDAEDLVQELYVRFAGAGPVGEHIENAEDYLFSVLRNLQYARVRRARTSAIDDLSVVDYDSAERGLRAIDRNGILFVREDLHRVCDYLCERKNTSRSASVFILRYFLGYFPYEVMQVVRSTRSAIDKAVRAARNEARLDLERPGVLRQIGSAKVRASKDTGDSQGLFLLLRAKIFRSCTGYADEPAVAWSPHGDHALLTNTFLPMDHQTQREQKLRLRPCAVAYVDIGEKRATCIVFSRSAAESESADSWATKAVSFGRTDHDVVVNLQWRSRSKIECYSSKDGGWSQNQKDDCDTRTQHPVQAHPHLFNWNSSSLSMSHPLSGRRVWKVLAVSRYSIRILRLQGRCPARPPSTIG